MEQVPSRKMIRRGTRTDDGFSVSTKVQAWPTVWRPLDEVLKDLHRVSSPCCTTRPTAITLRGVQNRNGSSGRHR